MPAHLPEVSSSRRREACGLLPWAHCCFRPGFCRSINLHLLDDVVSTSPVVSRMSRKKAERTRRGFLNRGWERWSSIWSSERHARFLAG